MPIGGASVAYATVGGLILYSGIKGATLSDTVKAVLSGNLTLSNTEPIQFGSSDSSASGSASGEAILSDAQKYSGHKYVFGGPSNPTDGWDCSSFVSYVLGHDLSLAIPGGSWASVTSNGKGHGPVASDYLSWSGATTVSASEVQPGDLACWPTHVGFAVDATHMFSAYDSAQGTLETPMTGPGGEGAPVFRHINAVGTSQASGGSVSTYQAYAFSLFSKYGWTKAEQDPLVKLWDKESGWNPNAKNADSGAAGIPQDISGNMHGGWQGQISWGLDYIHTRYGTPTMAWAHEQANNWY